MKDIELSIVVPVYGCANCLHELHTRLKAALGKVPGVHEILLVDDRAEDGSWKVISELADHDASVKGLRLSRNFGQHYAITAGLDHAIGNYVVVMDCDLQEDPAYIPDLYNRALEGYDIVYTQKPLRRHGYIKNFFAKAYSKLFNFLTDGVQSYTEVGAYSIISRRVVDAFKKVGDHHRHYLLILRWLGFPSSIIEIEHHPRYSGKSSYSFRRLVLLALDGITSQSSKLLRLTVAVGILFSAISFVGIVTLVVLYWMQGFKAGWASTMVFMLFSTGMIIFSIGVVGLYIGNIFDQVRSRPLYLVQERRNFPGDFE